MSGASVPTLFAEPPALLGHYELGVEVAPVFRLATAFDELQLAI